LLLHSAVAWLLPSTNHAAINRYFQPAGSTAANVLHWLRQTDRETDGRTPDSFTDHAPDKMQAMPVTATHNTQQTNAQVML